MEDYLKRKLPSYSLLTTTVEDGIKYYELERITLDGIKCPICGGTKFHVRKKYPRLVELVPVKKQRIIVKFQLKQYSCSCSKTPFYDSEYKKFVNGQSQYSNDAVEHIRKMYPSKGGYKAVAKILTAEGFVINFRTVAYILARKIK